MKLIRLSVCVLLLLSVAAPGFAALSKEYADFPKGPYQNLLTNDERKKFAAIATDDQARQFIDLFWARRDPTPSTPVNEYRDLIQQRVQFADAQWTTAKVKGSETDRGKVFILLGSPTRRGTTGNPGGDLNTGRGTDPSAGDDISYNPKAGARPDSTPMYPRELWVWEQGKTDIKLGQPKVEVAFVDQYRSNEWKMDRVIGTDYKSVFDRIARSYVVQPNLTEVPVFETAAAPAAATATVPLTDAAPAGPTAFTTEALTAAIAEARAAKTPPDTLYFTYGEYITPAGEHFVPVQLWSPKSAGLTADTEVTFFGVVEKEGGERVSLFEEPVKLTATQDDVFYARSLKLAPGTYNATFGFAREGKPVSVISRPVVVRGLDKDAPGVSPLLLATHIYALPEAQMPTDPFAFGGLKVVPKGDLRFRRADELWYFIELRNPGKDPATNLPNFTMQTTVTGKTADGRPVKMIGPTDAAQPQELKGVPGHWGIGQALPLQSFRPGEYTIAIKLADKALDKTYELKETFRVVE